MLYWQIREIIPKLSLFTWSSVASVESSESMHDVFKLKRPQSGFTDAEAGLIAPDKKGKFQYLFPKKKYVVPSH